MSEMQSITPVLRAKMPHGITQMLQTGEEVLGAFKTWPVGGANRVVLTTTRLFRYQEGAETEARSVPYENISEVRLRSGLLRTRVVAVTSQGRMRMLGLGAADAEFIQRIVDGYRGGTRYTLAPGGR